MVGEEASLVYQSSIWDLHIHTCKCPKGSSEFSKLSIDDYVSGLVDVFSKHEDLKMISFTDHNAINADVYHAFLNKQTGINLIVGIEVDAYLSNEDQEKDSFKHLIFYFDNQKFNLDEHSEKINKKLKSGPILLSSFLDFLITDIKVPFLISPHFMKQGKRGIESDWDAEKTEKNIDKYIDQMCCFWETSNNSSIQRAIEFLKEFDRGERVSIISFSDSNNFDKLQNYLNDPRQYFYSLPTFNGLRLAGTDYRRITKRKRELAGDQKGLYLGKIVQGENVIYLSPRLNSIVGGRGSGKSLLMDGVALYLDEKRTNSIFENASDGRIEYLKQLNYVVFDMNGNELRGHEFECDYYNQGYAQELFKKNSDLVSNEYFKDSFSQLNKYDVDETRNQILQRIRCDEASTDTKSNLASLDRKIVSVPDCLEINLGPKGKSVAPIKYSDFATLMEHLSNENFIDESLNGNEKVYGAKINLIKTIYEETFSENKRRIYDNVPYAVKDKYSKILNRNNKKRKEKSETVASLIAQFKNGFAKINHRVDLMNRYIKASSIRFSASNEIKSDGCNGREFIFRRSLCCQQLFDYLMKIFGQYFAENKLNSFDCSKKNKNDLLKLMTCYCYHCDDVLLDSKSAVELDHELSTLESYEIQIVEDILVKDPDSTEINLKHESPGTRANYLLEYIVFKETTKPLLIDQPEDNIDNETIYNDLTTWFSELKEKRQVIVVTHDANVVVNSDSENVIVCEQKSDNVFGYKYGALEYKDTLDKVSVILDGGKRAIERRLLKYGK